MLWKKQSGESVSNTAFVLGSAFFVVCALYGWHLKSVSMIVNAVVTGLAQIPIMWGLAKFKGFTKTERWIALAAALMPIWEYVTEMKGEFYLIFSVTIWVAFGSLFVELQKTKTTGALDIRLLSVYMIATIAWTVFAFSGEDMFFKISQSVLVSLMFATTTLWLIYRWREWKAARSVIRGRSL